MALLSLPKLEPYANFLALIWKYGNRGVLTDQGMPEPQDASDVKGCPDDLAEDLEKLGPTYVKLGQLLSGQLNIISKPYMKALSRLQDNVEPFEYEKVEEIVQEELGQPIAEAYASFEREPLAAASLGQVHRAVLHNGTQVAVKIQRPGVKPRIAEDLDALIPVAKLLDRIYADRFDFSATLAQLRGSLEQELDYRLEAQNLRQINAALEDYPELMVPVSHPKLSSERVLTMDFIEGVKITEIPEQRLKQVDAPRLASKTFKAYLDMILINGLFHADPHPGNVMLTGDGKIALIDLGMVGRVDPQLRDRLVQLVLAVIQGRGNHTADIAIKIGEPNRDFERAGFQQRISELVLSQSDQSLDALRFGEVILDIANICGDEGVRIPPQLTMIGKALVQLDDIGEHLDPDFNPKKAVEEHTLKIMTTTLSRTLSVRGGFDLVLELKELLTSAPGQINLLLDNLSRHDSGIKIDAIDEDALISGFEKIANRITVGVIVGAMVLGGALVLNVEWWGLPVVSMVLFTLAAIKGIPLLLAIWLNSR